MAAPAQLPARGPGSAALRKVAVPRGAPVLRPDEDVLAAFVYPLTVQEFLSSHYCESSVAWLGGGLARVQPIVDGYLHRGRVEDLVRHTASEAVHCWLRRSAPAAATASAAAAKQLDSLKLEDPAQALTAHAAGASLYMRAPQAMHDAFVPAFSDALGMAFAGYYDAGQTQPTGEIELFVSQAGHLTSWHTDFQHNFTLQLRGRKRWRFRRSRVPSAPRAITPHFVVAPDVVEQQTKIQRLRDADFAFGSALPPGDEETSVEVGPGDLIYFPAGMWHDVEALPLSASRGLDAAGGEATSLSVNISVTGGTWADAASSAVRHLLWRDDAWRRAVCVSPAGGMILSRLPLAEGGRPEEALSTAPGVASSAGQKRRRPGAAGEAAGHPQPSGPPALLAGLPYHALTGCHLDPVPEGGASASAPRGGIYEVVAGLLDRLRRSVARLRPEHLLPPLALLSARASDLAEFNEGWAVPRGFELRLHAGGRAVVTVLPEGCWEGFGGEERAAGGGARRGGGGRPGRARGGGGGASASAAAAPPTLVAAPLLLNPLAVLFPAAALGQQAAEPASRLPAAAGGAGCSSEDASSDDGGAEAEADADPAVPPGWVAWVAHINFGAAPDMASQARAVLHIPREGVARRALGEALRLGNAVAAVARRTAADSLDDDGAAAVTRSELQEAAAAAKGHSPQSPACAAAVGALLSALAFVGVLCEGGPDLADA